MYFTGVDLHKRFGYFTTIDSHGTIVKRQKVSNHPGEILHYFRSLVPQEGQELGDLHRVVVESTTGWYWFSDLCEDHRIPLVVAHAKYVKAIAYAKVKTDKVDAHILAQLLRMDFIPPAYQMPRHLRQLRDTMRARLKLVQKQVACINQIHRLLEKFNLTSPEQLEDFYALQYRLLYQQWRLLNEQIHRIEKALQPKLIPNLDIQRLLGIPGIGKINAFTIYLEIGDIDRFATDKQFFSYCRVVPGANNSAGKQRHRSGDKCGNSYLKLAFTDAAVHAIHYYPEIRHFYHRKKRQKNKRIAINLVAKEISKMAYHVLKDQQEFNGKFKGKPLSRTKKQRWPRLASPLLTLDA